MTELNGRTEIERKLDEEQQARLLQASNVSTAEAPPESEYSQPAFSGTVFTPPDASTQPEQRKSILHRWKDQGGVLGGIASVLLVIFKFFAPLFALLGKLKFLLIFKTILLTFGSMAISAWAYSTRFGWRFAIGIVLLIFFHECGHAAAGWIKGIKPGIMVFVPFMGAFVTLKGMGRSLEQDAFIGIAGPVFGTIGGLICCGLYGFTGEPFYISLAYFNFFMNLFNLAPTVPLDGGWIAPLFSPKLLAFGAVLMVVLGFRNPMIWVLGFMSLGRIIGGWKADPATQPYYRVSTAAKVKYGLAYAGLATFLGVAMMACNNILDSFISR